MAKPVKLEGFRELDAALAQLPKNIERSLLLRVAKKAMAPVRDRAKANAPRDQGDLADSIVMQASRLTRAAKSQDRKRPKKGVRLYVGTADKAGFLQEFGTVNQPAQPFFRPAWDGEKETLIVKVGRDLGPEIEKTAKRLAKRRAK